MRKPLKVTVTEEDLREGKRGDAEACAVARALGRALVDLVDHVAVYEDSDDSSIFECLGRRLSPRVSRLIRTWDSGKYIDPFVFQFTP